MKNVTMTFIIEPGSNHRLPFLKTCTLPTELHWSAMRFYSHTMLVETYFICNILHTEYNKTIYKVYLEYATKWIGTEA